MIRPDVVALVLAAAIFSTQVAAAAHPPGAVQQSAAKAVTRALEQSADAFARGDLAAASKVWSNSESLTVFEGGHVNDGWTDYRDNHLGPEMKELRHVSYRLSRIEPHVVGDTAWATFRYAISGEDLSSKTFSGTGIGTAVLERQGRTWRIVHWHTTSTPKPKVAPASPNPG